MATQVLENYIIQANRDNEKLDTIKEDNKRILKRFQELDLIMHKTIQRSGNISELQQDIL
jgi:hypothetical protein